MVSKGLTSEGNVRQAQRRPLKGPCDCVRVSNFHLISLSVLLIILLTLICQISDLNFVDIDCLRHYRTFQIRMFLIFVHPIARHSPPVKICVLHTHSGFGIFG